MLLRLICTAATTLALGGCSGWGADRQLIPVAERDPIGLTGTYVSGEERVKFSAGEDGYVLVGDPDNSDVSGRIVFDLLREEVSEVETDAAPLPRTYLMEVPWMDEGGKATYFYQIVMISGGEDGVSGSFKQFKVLCSSAARALAVRTESELCIFGNYARLREAAFDALSWYDDARMAIETTDFQREGVAGAAVPEPL